MHTNYPFNNLKERDHFANGMLLTKWVLNKMRGGKDLYTEFIWLWIGPSGCLF